MKQTLFVLIKIEVDLKSLKKVSVDKTNTILEAVLVSLWDEDPRAVFV